MKNVFRLFFVAMLLFVTAAYAEEDNLEKAEKVCGTLYSTDQRDACLKVVNRADYFNAKAIEVCARQYGSERIVNCMGAIADKTYTDTAVQECAGRYGSDRVISCFDAAGRKKRAEKSKKDVDVEYLRASVKKALELMEKRLYEKAENVLEDVVEALEE